MWNIDIYIYIYHIYVILYRSISQFHTYVIMWNWKLVAPHGITMRSLSNQGRVSRSDSQVGQDDLPCPFQRTGVFQSKPWHMQHVPSIDYTHTLMCVPGWSLQKVQAHFESFTCENVRSSQENGLAVEALSCWAIENECMSKLAFPDWPQQCALSSSCWLWAHTGCIQETRVSNWTSLLAFPSDAWMGM